MQKLTSFKTGDIVTVSEILFEGSLKERMLSLGLIKGTKVKIIRHGFKKHLTVYKFRNTKIALRKEESDLIIAYKEDYEVF